jgi:hypothetical protein
MTIEELTSALLEMDARLRILEHQNEIVRDLLSRCLIIPIPTPPPPHQSNEEQNP